MPNKIIKTNRHGTYQKQLFSIFFLFIILITGNNIICATAHLIKDRCCCNIEFKYLLIKFKYLSVFLITAYIRAID